MRKMAFLSSLLGGSTAAGAGAGAAGAGAAGGGLWSGIGAGLLGGGGGGAASNFLNSLGSRSNVGSMLGSSLREGITNPPNPWSWQNVSYQRNPEPFFTKDRLKSFSESMQQAQMQRTAAQRAGIAKMYEPNYASPSPYGAEASQPSLGYSYPQTYSSFYQMYPYQAYPSPY